MSADVVSIANYIENAKTQNVSQKPLSESNALIVAVGGGKGGVGKSFTSVNMACRYAQKGFRTLLVDLDLGSANVHTLLGISTPKLTWSDYLCGTATQLEQLISETPVKGLSIISGANDDLDIANTNDQTVKRIQSGIYALKYDVIILDLGAGTHSSTLSFFTMANRSVLVMNPDPTSVENAYRFLKASFFKKFKNIEASFGIRKIVREAMSHRNGHSIKRPKDLIDYLIHHEPAYANKIHQSLQSFKIGIVMNQVRTQEDIDLSESVTMVCRNYFGFAAENFGYIDYDDAVWQSLRKKKPVSIACPHSHVVTQLDSMITLMDERLIKRAAA